MAPGSNLREQRISHMYTLSTALSSAAAEWLLMLLLFLGGLFSCLVTKFARYSKLQNPCLFCSRLDHILGQERPGFYKNLICHAHKLEISSSAFCHIHEKLADVRDMCEACLLSFATENKSNSETYRSLVGKLERNLVTGQNAHLRLPAAIDPDGPEVELQGDDVVQVPLLKKNHTLDSPRTRNCSCCHALFNKKLHVQRLLQTKSTGAEGLELDVALFSQTVHDGLHGGDGSSMRQEKSLGLSASSHMEDHSFGPLPHIGYTELKVTSDSESEVSPSDDDNDGSVPVGTDDLKVDIPPQSLKQELSVDLEHQNVLPKNLLCEVVPEKQIHTIPILPEPSSLLPVEQIHPAEHHDGDSFEHGLEELSWKEFKENDQTLTSPTSKHISETSDSNLDEAEVSHIEHCIDTIEGHDHPALPDKVISDVSNMKLDDVEIGDVALVPSATTMEEPQNLNLTETESTQIQTTGDPGSLMHNHMDLNDAYKLAISYRMNQPSPRESYRVHENLKPLLSQISAARGLEFPWSDLTPSPRVRGQIGDPALVSSATNMEEPNNLNSTETESRQTQATNDPGSSMHNHMDLNDAYKMAISYRMDQPSPRDSYRVHEDLKLLLSQLSAARGLDFPWRDTTPSPRMHGQSDDLKMSDASSSTSQQNLNKRLSMERNESGFESLDGSIVSEIEGESPVDRFKRQIELDRKSMSLLYKELEEERNASAIAANQAMAMITRLQEEKAAMQMEALQYQRMMEEQAEYDQEALQKSNDLLAQKEEELRDLKAEIESYKKWSGDKSLPTKMKDVSEEKEYNHVERPLVKPSDDKNILERSDKVFLDAEGDKGATLETSMLDFDDEKIYISERLKSLEKKLHLFSNNGTYVDVSRPFVSEDGLPVHVLGNGHLHEKDIAELNNSVQGHWQEMAQEGIQSREDASLNQRESSFDWEESHLNGEFTNKGNHSDISKLPKLEDENRQSPVTSRETDLVDIGNEVLRLNYRLESLEADRSFLEHTINSLRNGDDGIQLVQEIASNLRELRRIGVRRREQAFA